MAANMSNYLRNKVYDVSLRATAYTAPATVYVAIYTTDPTAADVGTEVTGGSYARTAVTMGAPTNGSGSNSALVTFPTATGTWGAVTHFGIRDANAAGNLLFFGPLSNPDTVIATNVFTIPATNLSVALT